LNTLIAKRPDILGKYQKRTQALSTLFVNYS